MKTGLHRLIVPMSGFGMLLLLSGCGDLIWHRDKDNGKKSMTGMSDQAAPQASGLALQSGVTRISVER
jgi:hypothetical protein